MDRSDKLKELLNRLETLQQQQQNFGLEIARIRRAILLMQDESQGPVEEETPRSLPVESEPVFNAQKPVNPKTPGIGLERFIGENLASKLGILVLVLGVAFGIKYAIEHSIMGPVMRVVAGYILGTSLYFTGRFLKNKYASFAAVLVSGALSVLYLVTYGAWDSYHIFPQLAAFALMVFFTAVCVYEAVRFDLILIAHFGLIGAYTIPFLLSTGEENEVALFTYMAIINMGILTLSYFRNWTSLQWVSLIITWSIFGLWFGLECHSKEQYSEAILFSTIFYLIFYALFIIHRLKSKTEIGVGQIVLILTNSFLAFLFGYYALLDLNPRLSFGGLFALAHAAVHLIFSLLVYSRNREDKKLLYMVLGLFLSCITIAIPVQFDGNWVTLMWATEAAVLLVVGRKASSIKLQQISVLLLVIAAISHVMDLYFGFYGFNQYSNVSSAIWNISFFTTVFYFILSMGSLIYKRIFPAEAGNTDRNVLRISAVLGLGILFLGMDQELAKLLLVKLQGYRVFSLSGYYAAYQVFWQFVFAALFILVLQGIGLWFSKDKDLSVLAQIVTLWFIPTALAKGLSALQDLQHAAPPIYGAWQRYMFLFVLLALLYFFGRNTRKYFGIAGVEWRVFEIYTSLCVLVILSAELVHQLQLAAFRNHYGFGLSFLWGMYGSALVAFGIIKGKKHLRLLALGILAAVFLKLFLFDSQGMESLPKTILYISLGLLLLVVSYLYNRFKGAMGEEREEK